MPSLIFIGQILEQCLLTITTAVVYFSDGVDSHAWEQGGFAWWTNTWNSHTTKLSVKFEFLCLCIMRIASSAKEHQLYLSVPDIQVFTQRQSMIRRLRNSHIIHSIPTALVAPLDIPPRTICLLFSSLKLVDPHLSPIPSYPQAPQSMVQ